MRFPLLAINVDSILTFALCPKCAEFLTYPCTHTEEECMITGTYTYAEIYEAVKEGYEIVEVFELLFCKQTAKIFEQCINVMAALKVAHSGWPADVITDAQKEEYIQGFRAQRIHIATQEVQKSASSKKTLKYLINSLWGRTALNKDKYKLLGMAKTTEELVALFKDQGPHKLESLINDVTCPTVLYQYSDTKVKKSIDTNVLLACMITSLSRIKLYRDLKKIGMNLGYTDTDSVIFLRDIGDRPIIEEGYGVGYWQSEITKAFGLNYIAKTFVGLSPKSYSIMAVHKYNGNQKYVVKIKGLTLHEGDEEKNFNKLVEMVFNEELEYAVPVTQFVIDSKAGNVHFKNFVKHLRDTSHKKNVLSNKRDTIPWGTIE